MVDQLAELPGKHEQQRGRYRSEEQALVQQRLDHPPDLVCFARDLCRRQLRHQQLGQRVEQAGGKRDNRQRHALNDAVAGQRAVSGEARAFQPARDEQVLQRGQRRARVGRHGQRQRYAQHPPCQMRNGVSAAPVAPPVGRIDGCHQNERGNIRRYAARRYGGAVSLQIAAWRQVQKQHHAPDADELLDQMHCGGFPHAAAGGEVSAEHGRERDARQAQCRDLQREDGARVADP